MPYSPIIRQLLLFLSGCRHLDGETSEVSPYFFNIRYYGDTDCFVGIHGGCENNDGFCSLRCYWKITHSFLIALEDKQTTIATKYLLLFSSTLYILMIQRPCLSAGSSTLIRELCRKSAESMAAVRRLLLVVALLCGGINRSCSFTDPQDGN